MAETQANLSLATLVAEVHRLATGQPLTITEAREYFRNPKHLADVVRRSGLLVDRRRRRRLEQLLAVEESTHGL